MKKKIIIYLIIFQLFVISIITYYIYEKKMSILGASSVNVLKVEEFNFPQIDGLKYFYEPKPNSTNVIDLDWENTDGPEFPTYRINSDGLNQITNFPVEKKKGVFRIVTLGDSFTFGQNVNTEDNYPSQLQDLLDRECKRTTFQVFNLGVRGYDIQYELARFKKRGLKYNPDAVIILITDMKRLLERMIDIIGYNFTPETFPRARAQIAKELGLEYMYNLQISYLADFKKLFSGKIMIISYRQTLTDEEEKLLSKFSIANKIAYHVLPNLSEIPAAIIENDGHPSERGHEIIADSILDYLNADRYVQCNQ